MVTLVPTGQPNLKQVGYPLASAAQRVEMLQRGIADYASGEVERWYAHHTQHVASTPESPGKTVRFAIETLEIDRAQTSFTIDTAHALRARGVFEIHWLIGADQLLSLHRWHRFEELMSIVQFHVMHRPGYQVNWAELHPLVQVLRDRLIEVPQLSISATEIRRRILERLPLEDLLTPGVSEYIAARRLYV